MDVIKFGWSYYKKYLFNAILCFVIYQAVTFCGLLFPVLNSIIIDFVLTKNTTADVNNVLFFQFLLSGKYGAFNSLKLFTSIFVIYALFLFIRHVCLYFHWNIAHYNGVSMEERMRHDVMDKYLSQNSQVLNRYNTGEMMTIQNTDTILYKELYMNILPVMFYIIIMILLCFFFLITINFYLIFVPIVFLPFFAVIALKYVKKTKITNTEIRNCNSELSMTVQENINAVRVVRSFASEEQEKLKFGVKNENVKKAHFKHIEIIARYGNYFGTLRFIAYFSSLIISSLLAVNGAITIGEFFAFYTYTILILDGTVNLVNYIHIAQNYYVCAQRAYVFLNTGNIIKNPENPVFIKDNPDIEINNLTVMINDQTLLKNVNINIPYGKKLGIMGNTGSGKTVIFKMLHRFYDPMEGGIYINGNNLKELGLENVRRQYSYVPQDVFLFSETVENNIAFYDKEFNFDEVEKCAKLACAHTFILNLDEGYKTIIGERGLGLSGGQKQRISIARALYKDAPVLILDDAASALDTETESELLNNIYDNFGEKTVIIAAHRASAVLRCDEIIYLKNGEITERGTHDELIKLRGDYYDVFVSQSAEIEA